MKKIMFNDKYGLTDAVLTRRKTMTRRIIPLRTYNCIDFKAYKEGDVECAGEFDDEGWIDWRRLMPYNIGQEVAIAMSYEDVFATEDIDIDRWIDMVEKAHGGKDYRLLAGTDNKMFVKADLMPWRIKITDMRMEQLQDISDEDCLREGVEHWLDGYIVSGLMERSGRNNRVFDTPREAFAALIDRINGRGTWQDNPWVVAYTMDLQRAEGFKEQETNK